MSKKIILWIDSNFLHFSLAYYLQKTLDCKFYAIIDITNKTKEFFLTQNLVKFEKIWYYFDHVNSNNMKPDLDFLEKFEKRYDVNLWELAINERIFYKFNPFHQFTDKEILSILTEECTLFEEILDEVEPDFLLIKETIQHKDHLFYEMCKTRGIKIILSYLTKTLSKCVLSNEAHKFNSVCDFESISSKEQSLEDLQNYLKSSDLLGKNKSLVSSFLGSRKLRIKGVMNFFLFNNNSNVKTHYTYFGRTKLRVLLHEIKSNIAKKSRWRFIEKHLLTQIPKNENFVYFPLQVDQERNLLLATPFLTDQLVLIKHLAKSLPVNYKLYVKEHIAQAMRNWRDISEYKEILKIPNVRFFHPNVNNEEIYKKASLLVTAGGSTGLEATFYGTPSIIFADLGYSVLPFIHKLNSLDELPFAISQYVNEKVDPIFLSKYLKFLEENSFDFDWIGFINKQHDYFFFGGQLIDVKITESKMAKFLNEHEDFLKQFTLEHIKRIESIS